MRVALNAVMGIEERRKDTWERWQVTREGRLRGILEYKVNEIR